MSRPSRSSTSQADSPRAGGRLRGDPGKQRRYESLAKGPFFVPVVELASAYVAAAIADPTGTEGEYWALSCLPGTTPRRLSALTMRITDILVIHRPEPVQPGQVDALMIVKRSTLEAGFGARALARKQYPRLRFTDSDYHGAGPDQMMVSGPGEQLVRALRDERVAEAARRMAEHMMRGGRVMHWRGHNPLLADHVIPRRGEPTKITLDRVPRVPRRVGPR